MLPAWQFPLWLQSSSEASSTVLLTCHLRHKTGVTVTLHWDLFVWTTENKSNLSMKTKWTILVTSRCVFGQDVMLLGDFNADCGYLPKKYRKNVRLITDNKLYWLIPDKTDTTVRESTSCAYDRWGHTGTCIASRLDTTPVWTNSDHNVSKMWIHHTR